MGQMQLNRSRAGKAKRAAKLVLLGLTCDEPALVHGLAGGAPVKREALASLEPAYVTFAMTGLLATLSPYWSSSLPENGLALLCHGCAAAARKPLFYIDPIPAELG